MRCAMGDASVASGERFTIRAYVRPREIVCDGLRKFGMGTAGIQVGIHDMHRPSLMGDVEVDLDRGRKSIIPM